MTLKISLFKKCTSL